MNDMNLYTHDLYVDGVGSSSVRLLTSWRCGRLTRNINLFPQKMLKGLLGFGDSCDFPMKPKMTFFLKLPLPLSTTQGLTRIDHKDA